MKLNSTVVLTLVLLSTMLGAGSVSALLGFNLGSAALKGVTQPDARPTTKLVSNKSSSQQGGLVMLKEEDILKSVKARIEIKGKGAKPEKPKPDEEQKEKKDEKKKDDSAEEAPQQGFPVVAQDKAVSLAVQSARYSGGALLMKVKFKNTGTESVRFLYSFLDVTDDQGRTLSASTEGLPAELPGNGQTFAGTISIPTALLDNVKKLSLTLTDYPDQKLKLEMHDIPVER